MPELPEIETIKEALKRSVEGARILHVSIFNRCLRIKIPEDFENIAINTQIKRIYRKAKYALLELDNGYTIIWHFGMSGRVKIVESIPEKLDKHDHIIIQTTLGNLIYNDARRFGMMTYIKTDTLLESSFFIHVGIEPFDNNFDALYLRKKFENKKTPIKLALLDQSIVCGIGNIYASEALYTARISPFRESHSLSTRELTKLVDAIKETLKKAINAGGSTLKDYRKPDGSMGYFQHQHCVYDKTGKPCPNCSCNLSKTGGINKTIQSGRSTYYCPHLQK